jgi:hypothetical protein
VIACAYQKLDLENTGRVDRSANLQIRRSFAGNSDGLGRNGNLSLLGPLFPVAVPHQAYYFRRQILERALILSGYALVSMMKPTHFGKCKDLSHRRRLHGSPIR